MRTPRTLKKPLLLGFVAFVAGLAIAGGPAFAAWLATADVATVATKAVAIGIAQAPVLTPTSTSSASVSLSRVTYGTRDVTTYKLNRYSSISATHAECDVQLRLAQRIDFELQ